MPPRGYQKKQNIHKCQYCTYATHRRSFMNDHIRVHTGEKPFSCDTCGKSFSQKSNLRQHLKVHNQGINTYHCCKQCDFKTKWKSSLQVHERMHKGEKPYKCKICDRSFSQSTHCQTHMREAHLNMRNFQCDICSKTFKRHEHLERHLAFHKEERNHECDICHKKYLDARYLKQHKLIHEGDASKIHQCSLCSYKSRYRQGLKIHTRTHTGLRPYSCKECSKAFVTGQSLKLHHRMVHQGLAGKIFHCHCCNFSTANNQNLKQHIRRIHDGQKDRRTIKCQYCSSLHTNRSSLKSHMAKIHAKQLNDNVAHKLKPLSRSPIKIIGSLSPTNIIENSTATQVRRSPRSKLKLHLKAESSKPGSFISVKTEDDEKSVKGELVDKVDICSLEKSVQSKSGKLQKPGKIAKKDGDPGSQVSVQVDEGQRDTVVSSKGNKNNKKSTIHSMDNKGPKVPKIQHEILKIKLNLPKSKTKLHSLSARPRSPGSSGNSFSRSPGSEKLGKKPMRKVTPSKERARALFVDPEQDMNPNASSTHSSMKQASAVDPSMPNLQKHPEPLDYSVVSVQRVAGVISTAAQNPVNSRPHLPSNPQILQITKPYDSLRDIAAQFQFLNNNVQPANKPAMSSKNSPVTGSHCEKDMASDIQVKEEPDSDCYISSTQTHSIPVQETALDMRCVKLE